MVKKLVKGALSRLGYEVRRLHKHQLAFGRGLYDPVYLSRLCQARTVIDVGVGFGTQPLYDAFPDAYLILVEALDDYEDTINQILTTRKGQAIFSAVGNKSETRSFNVDTANPELSSFSTRTALTRKENVLDRREISVRTLDAIVQDCGDLERPILLKIDTEGNELAVLEGATSTLGTVDCVIAEVSIAGRFEGGYEFEDVLKLMVEHGFYLYSMLFVAHVVSEDRPRFADVVFMRKNL